MRTDKMIARHAACTVILALLLATGCATGRQTGALAGGGLGMLGGALVGDTGGALIGAAIGTGLGYIIGDQIDRRSEVREDVRYEPADVGALGDTRWVVVSMEPRHNVPEFRSKIIDFTSDGRMITITTSPNGDVVVDRENYLVEDGTLVITKPNYVVRAQYSIRGDEMTITAEGFRTVLRRL